MPRASEPSVLHRDDGLRRKVLQQGNLLVGKGPDFLTIGGDETEERAVLSERDIQDGADALQLGSGAGYREWQGAHVGDVDKALAIEQPLRRRARRIVRRTQQCSIWLGQA